MLIVFRRLEPQHGLLVRSQWFNMFSAIHEEIIPAR
jgi:hypothetical protein